MMDENNKDNKDGNTGSDAQEINFKYMKSNFYRVIHANGAFGGLTGRGEIHIGFYSERLEFPDSSKITMSSTGEVSSEQFEGGGDHVREIEADVVIGLNTAKQIRVWLDTHITVMETLIRQAQQETTDHVHEITIPEN